MKTYQVTYRTRGGHVLQAVLPFEGNSPKEIMSDIVEALKKGAVEISSETGSVLVLGGAVDGVEIVEVQEPSGVA